MLSYSLNIDKQQRAFTYFDIVSSQTDFNLIGIVFLNIRAVHDFAIHSECLGDDGLRAVGGSEDELWGDQTASTEPNIICIYCPLPYPCKPRVFVCLESFEEYYLLSNEMENIHRNN